MTARRLSTAGFFADVLICLFSIVKKKIYFY